MAQLCGHCGAPVGTDDRYCARCGAALTSAAAVPSAGTPRPEPADPPGAPRRSPWWAVLWIAVPLAVAIVLLVATNPSRDAYARWLAGQVAAAPPAVAARVPAATAPSLLVRGTIAQNELIFTIFDTRVRGLRIDVLGILDHFVPLGPSPVD
jgi:hypothetical protein